MTLRKKIACAILAPVALLLAVILCYLASVLISYHRLEDNLELTVLRHSAEVTPVPVGEELDILSYNIGFAAYTPDFSFFMDGGTESRARSEESVRAVMADIVELIDGIDPDFLLVEEVDEHATRSHFVNQRAWLKSAVSPDNAVFAINYDSPYLFYPILEPHGKSLAGMMTSSRFTITSATRRRLPIETSLMKLVDLDRCYSVCYFPTDKGNQLVLYTVHLSAYTSDGTIAEDQLRMLIADMQSQVDTGNYVVCGGDFNKDLTGLGSEAFGVQGGEYTWAQPIPDELFTGTDLSLIAPYHEEAPVPSCRNADAPYNSLQYVITVDGFIVSNNVRVVWADVIDTGFAYSDHNPVKMTFVLD